MSMISGTIPNLIGGISQQPPVIRLENAAAMLRNAIDSVVSGRRKRPPIIFDAKFQEAPSDLGDVAYYLWRRESPSLMRHVVITPTGIRVFTTDGVEEPVTEEEGALDYLAAARLRPALGFLPIADTLFIFNREVDVQSNAGTSSIPLAPQGLYTTVAVEQAVVGVQYSIERNGVIKAQAHRATNAPVSGPELASHLQTRGGYQVAPTEGVQGAWEIATPGSGVATPKHEYEVPRTTEPTTDPTKELLTGLVPCVRYGHVLSIEKYNSGDAYTAAPEAYLRVYDDTIPAFTDLPPFERPYRHLKITGEINAEEDAYYVYFDPADKLWKETYGPEANIGLDPATMPHVLRDNGDGTWTFGPETWAEREAGDDNNNPLPSFVGWPIQALTLIKDRLTIIADNSVVMSRSREYTNFFRTTTSALLADDRLDLSVSAPGKPLVRLRHVSEFPDGVILFGDSGQYRIDIKELTSGSFQVLPLSDYPSRSEVPPLPFGQGLMFVDDGSDGTSWAAVRELARADNNITMLGEPVTRHVPKLIPSGVSSMTLSESSGCAAVLSEGDRTKLFFYSSYRADNSRIQSAWIIWDSPGTRFVSVNMVEKRLYILAEFAGQLMLGHVDVEEGQTAEPGWASPLLDWRIDQDAVEAHTVVLSEDGDRSRATLPFNTEATTPFWAVVLERVTPYPGSAGVIGVTPEDAADGRGMVLTGTRTTETQYLFDPNLEVGSEFYLGVPYEFYWELSPVYLRDQNKVAILDGAVRLRQLVLSAYETSSFVVTVRDERRDPIYTALVPPAVMTVGVDYAAENVAALARALGVTSYETFYLPPMSGKFPIAVRGLGEAMDVTITNNSPYQCRFVAYDWYGRWRPTKDRR